MSEIARRVWHEPAVFIGLLASIALAIITIATGDPWDTAAIAGIAAPLISALGIRQLVTPAGEVTRIELDEKTLTPPGGPPPP